MYLSSCKNSDSDVCLDTKPSDLELAADDVFLTKKPDNLRIFSNGLNCRVRMFAVPVRGKSHKILVKVFFLTGSLLILF